MVVFFDVKVLAAVPFMIPNRGSPLVEIVIDLKNISKIILLKIKTVSIIVMSLILSRYPFKN